MRSRIEKFRSSCFKRDKPNRIFCSIFGVVLVASSIVAPRYFTSSSVYGYNYNLYLIIDVIAGIWGFVGLVVFGILGYKRRDDNLD